MIGMFSEDGLLQFSLLSPIIPQSFAFGDKACSSSDRDNTEEFSMWVCSMWVFSEVKWADQKDPPLELLFFQQHLLLDGMNYLKEAESGPIEVMSTWFRQEVKFDQNKRQEIGIS